METTPSVPTTTVEPVPALDPMFIGIFVKKYESIDKDYENYIDIVINYSENAKSKNKNLNNILYTVPYEFRQYLNQLKFVTDNSIGLFGNNIQKFPIPCGYNVGEKYYTLVFDFIYHYYSIRSFMHDLPNPVPMDDDDDHDKEYNGMFVCDQYAGSIFPWKVLSPIEEICKEFNIEYDSLHLETYDPNDEPKLKEQDLKITNHPKFKAYSEQIHDLISIIGAANSLCCNSLLQVACSKLATVFRANNQYGDIRLIFGYEQRVVDKEKEKEMMQHSKFKHAFEIDPESEHFKRAREKAKRIADKLIAETTPAVDGAAAPAPTVTPADAAAAIVAAATTGDPVNVNVGDVAAPAATNASNEDEEMDDDEEEMEDEEH